MIRRLCNGIERRARAYLGWSRDREDKPVLGTQSSAIKEGKIDVND